MKKLDVSVKNLGQIKEATFNIRPMTVITGPNGTGKSFFTKTLYSVFNVVNKNVYHVSINEVIGQIKLQLDTLVTSIKYGGNNDFESMSEIDWQLETLEKEFEEANTWKINDYLAFAVSKVVTVEKIHKSYTDYLKSLQSKPTKFNSIKSISETINESFEDFLLQLKNSRQSYAEFFSTHLESELKDNFQISKLSELIRFDEKIIEINVDELLAISLKGNKKISFSIGADFIDEVANLSSVVFFESPAYWKVRDALKSAKNHQNRTRFIGKKKNDDVLIGVPNYFYDLDDKLNIKTKTEGTFKAATDLLDNTLGGEFIFKGDNLSFKDKSGREISKNLVSFGMTNLGMIQALLKHNVITEGSFIFIDEPETNLHPDWQVKLAEVLLVLAQRDVNIVITTHSSDFVKALEVKIKKLHIEVMEDFLSVHFVDVDGKLLEFESTDKMQQLIEARSLLNLAYEELYFSDL